MILLLEVGSVRIVVILIDIDRLLMETGTRTEQETEETVVVRLFRSWSTVRVMTESFLVLATRWRQVVRCEVRTRTHGLHPHCC